MANNDAHLVRQTLAGDTAAFGQLVERYSGLVHGSILAIIRRPDEVEDLVQETFCKAYQKLGELRRKTHFAPWVAQIAQRAALHYVRHREVRRRAEDTQESIIPLFQPPRPDEAIETDEREYLMRQALDRLEPAQRRLVILYHVEDCTLQQIAHFLQTPVATVRWRLRKAEGKLGRHFIACLGEGARLGSEDQSRTARKVLAAIAPLAFYPITNAQAGLVQDHAHAPLLLSVAASIAFHFIGLGLASDFTADTSAAQPVHRRGYAGLTAQIYVPETPVRPALPALQRIRTPIAPPPVAPAPPPLPPSATAVLLSERDAMRPPDIALQPTAPAKEPTQAPDPANPVEATASDDLDLLLMEEVARVSNNRAVVYTDPVDRKNTMGLLQFRPLRMAGAGVPRAVLAEFIGHLHVRTNIRADLAPRRFSFRASELLEAPIHFLLQTHPAPLYGRDRRRFTYLEPDEIEHLGAYLRRDGFLYVEGNQWYLAEIYHYIHHALDGQLRIFPLPGDHPLYSAHHDFAGGFPGEGKKGRTSEKVWYEHPDPRTMPQTDDPLGLWGIELNGQLAVVFCDLVLLGRLPPPNEKRNWSDLRAPQLAAVTNILAYALTRPNGLAVQRTRPQWTYFSEQH